MRIRLTVEGESLSGALDDNATSRDFASLLPLTLTLEDYNGTEKISTLPKRLSTEGAPKGSDPSAGDLAYYAPWGNLAVFYRDFAYSSGLLLLGRLDAGSESLARPGTLEVRIELADPPGGAPSHEEDRIPIGP